MTDAHSIAAHRRLLAEFRRHAAAAAAAEQSLRQLRDRDLAATDARFQTITTQIATRHETAQSRARDQFHAARTQATSRYQADSRAAQQRHDNAAAAARKIAHESIESAQKTRDHAAWEAQTVYDATKNGPGLELNAQTARLATLNDRAAALHEEALALLTRRHLRPPEPNDDPRAQPATSPRPAAQQLEHALAEIESSLHELDRQFLARLFASPTPVLYFLGLFAAAALALHFGTALPPLYWLPLSLSLASLTLGLTGAALYPLARRRAHETYARLDELRRKSKTLHDTALADARETADRRRAEITARRDDDVAAAEETCETKVAELREQQRTTLNQLADELATLKDELTRAHDDRQQTLQSTYDDLCRQLDQDQADDSSRADADHADSRQRITETFDRDWAAAADAWHTAFLHFQSRVDRALAARQQNFPEFDALDGSPAGFPNQVPPAIPVGHYAIDLTHLPDGLPASPELRPRRTDFELPAFLEFDAQKENRAASLLISANEDELDAADHLLAAVMLRLLTALPPGRVRFTIIDPARLGRAFSAFMHLADYDQRLVGPRIWTEPLHIEQQLGELTVHMEDVTQTCLRNQYDSLAEYNAQAGQFAEPYHVLVLAGAPAQLTEAALRRLHTILEHGPRCGVFTLLSARHDIKQKPTDSAHTFSLDAVAAHAIHLRLHRGQLTHRDPDFEVFPLHLDPLPTPAVVNRLIHGIGQAAKDARHVEVPFASVAPSPADRWTHDSAADLTVPIGVAPGGKTHALRLGHGTSQHVLVSGKTGSGKSTLLHAIITNLALRYPPDEVELYLVDFKKGVEFKAYAAYRLPHARVIAIESEREFGLSVLQNLDEEMKRRGELFRAAGVQDLPAYRASNETTDKEKVPRIVLVADEFQEWFVADDRIAQDASLLLDRLVRQGRAFGIHILLGSQTLAGAYSLARSTIGQMAVRVALQCSENDAHLILSEDNTAARLLTRPGEAIYNDANGLTEGNQPFQVVWLSDDRREAYLSEVAALAAEHRDFAPDTQPDSSAEPAAFQGPIVFEGNAAPDPAHDRRLHRLLAAGPSSNPLQDGRAFLGAAVAIADPTTVNFRRESGSNLLLIAPANSEPLGPLASALVGLAATSSRDDQPAQLVILSGSAHTLPHPRYWHELTEHLNLDTRIFTANQAADALALLADHLDRRQSSPDDADAAPPIYFLITELNRFRELRRRDDLFSFDRPAASDTPDPAEQLRDLLRDGPSFGIHSLLWCDTYHNLTRHVDRETLRELSIRILFRMTGTDSSNLIDSAAAADLPAHRALFYSENESRLERFRPYALPHTPWLKDLTAPQGNFAPPSSATSPKNEAT